MKMEIKKTGKDDPTFCEMMESIIYSVVEQCNLQYAVIVKVDNWFDHKWLDFTHKYASIPKAAKAFGPVRDFRVLNESTGGFGSWNHAELVIPPFHPNRIVAQTAYEIADGDSFKEFELPPMHIEQPSLANKDRTISSIAQPAIFVWWSGNTMANGQGALMLYSNCEDYAVSWYVSFKREKDWGIFKTFRIAQDEIESLMGLE